MNGNPVAHAPVLPPTGAAREAHSASQSRNRDAMLAAIGEGPTPASDAWEIFTDHADELVRKYCSSETREVLTPPSKDVKSSLELLCGPGADTGFDCMIVSLARVCQDRPKKLVDAIMSWRQARTRAQSTSEQASAGLQEGRPRAKSNLPSPELNGLGPSAPLQSLEVSSATEDRRTRVCTYILLRVLAEIFSTASVERLGLETIRMLQDIIFKHQLLPYAKDPGAKAPLLDRTAETAAKWDMTAVVWGHMSKLDFQKVSELLLAELQSLQASVGLKGLSDKNIDNVNEKHLRQLLRGMRYSRLPHTSEANWLRSCNFLSFVADMFATVHGSSPKTSYAKFVGQVLLPVAADIPPYLDIPAWRQVYQKLYDRLSRLSSKAKYFHYAYPALAILNCLAPPESFEVRWRDLMGSLSAKLRERNSRAVYLRAVARMLWIRLRRGNDSDVSVHKILDDVTRTVYFSGKKYSISAEPAVAESLIELIRVVADANQDFCIRTVVFPLLNTEIFINHKGPLSVTDLDPDKTVIGIRGFLALMEDLEQQRRPPFPSSFHDERDLFLLDTHVSSNIDGTSSTTRKTLILKSHRRSSKPARLSSFADKEPQRYQTFCQVLNRITRICNNSHGGEAVINQQVSTATPKTPLIDTPFFRTRDDPTEDPAAYYDLLRTAIRTLPKCPSPDISSIEMVTLLCFGVAHPESNIADESSKALTAIAQQGKAHLVVQRFTVFIFNYDTKYSTLSDSGMLGPDFVEQTLSLYTTLLNIWLDEVLAKIRGPQVQDVNPTSDQKHNQLDKTSTWHLVDRVESQGLLFLCSPSSRVRRFAVQVLEAVTKFDEALGTDNARIYHTMQRTDLSRQKIDKDTLTTYEQTILDCRTYKRKDWQTVFDRIASSSEPVDSTFWGKIFPHLARAVNEECPVAVAQTRNDVCARLVQMQPVIEHLGRRTDGVNASPPDGPGHRIIPHHLMAANNVTIEQWRNYLTFACATLNSLRAEPRTNHDTAISPVTNRHAGRANGADRNESISISTVQSGNSLNKVSSSVSQPPTSTDNSHGRTSSKSSSSIHDSLDAENDLLARVTPLLYVEDHLVRDATSNGLGSINKHLFRPLVESLVAAAHKHEDMVENSGLYRTRTSRSGAVSRRHGPYTFSAEVAQVYSLTGHYLQENEYSRDDYVMNRVTSYVNALFAYLRDLDLSPDVWRLRRFFCVLVDQIYSASSKLPDSSRYMSFQDRKTIFMTLEEWHSLIIESPDARMDRMKLPTGHHQRAAYHAAARKEIGKLGIALLSAMSTLCAGPLRIRIGQTEYSFQPERIMEWADKLLNNDADKQHKFGQRALINLITYNPEYPIYPILLDMIIRRLYTSTKSKAVASYLDVLRSITRTQGVPKVPLWKTLGALLYVLGNTDRDVRRRASQMLRAFDEAQAQGISSLRLRDLDISIADKTMVVYKRAQFEIASTLASAHPTLAVNVFSELSQYFVRDEATPEQQRNLVTVLLPWLRNIELQLEPLPNAPNRPSDASYLVLVNLLQITFKSGKTLHTEVQAMWQTLVTGAKTGNLKLIMDFVIDLCLEQKDQACLNCAKQIVVYLATAKADQLGTDHAESVISFLLLQIRPRTMITEERTVRRAILPREFAFVADIKEIFPAPAKTRLSHGLVCLILLVDLIVSPMALESDRLLHLLVSVSTYWDHESDYCREQVREMLIHLIHELVISHLDGGILGKDNPEMDALVDLIRNHDQRVAWSSVDGLTYEPHEELPTGMSYLVPRMLNVFEATYPSINREWAMMTLTWAMDCPVPHLACRSLQLYRCCLQSISQSNVSDVLTRLATTASADNDRLQQYSTELLRACRQMATLDPPPERVLVAQLFWVVCGALESAHEMEFSEALTTLELILPRLNMADAFTVEYLLNVRPANWQWSEQALCGLIYKGLSSKASFEKSLSILNTLAGFPSNAIVGQETRKDYIVMANVVPLSYFFGQPRDFPEYSETSRILAHISRDRGWTVLSKVFDDYATTRWNPQADFTSRVASAIRMTFFPASGRDILQFLLGMLSNSLEWLRKEVLILVGAILAETDVRKVDFGGEHREVLAPLRRVTRPMRDVHGRTAVVEAFALDAITYCHGLLGKKRYDLYGSPTETGWSISDPALAQSRLRDNLNSLYAKYRPTSGSLETENKTPQIGHGIYIDTYNTPRIASDVSHFDIIDDVHGQLEELDSFFFDDEPGSMANDTHNSSENMTSKSTPFGTPMLDFTGEEESQRQHSQHYRAGSRRTPPREAVVMSPSAFAATPRRARPGMHRSVTSPPGSIEQTPPDRGIMNADASTPVDHEPFSDDDLSTGRASTGESSFAGNNIRPNARPMGSFRSGVRSLSRRLTGGRRAQLEQSPEVPQVPLHYLQNVPQSSEL